MYPNSRAELVRRVAAGTAPDTELLGQNHLGGLGVEATIHEPSIRPRGGPLGRRVLWNLRELAIPFEVGRATDVVVTPLAAFLPLAARLRARPRVVVVNYGLCTTWERSSAIRRRILGTSVRSAAAVVCLGSWQRDLLVRQTGLAPERALEIRLGVDERFFAPAPAPRQKEPLVLAVGKDLARDFSTFADALRPLGLPAVVATLPRNLERVRLPHRVEARFVDPVELRRLYREAACVVVPQRSQSYRYGSEGGGLTALLEAMACARPLVVTDRPMIREYVEHERTALFVPAEEPDRLSEAITRVVEDRELGAALGAAARRRVEAGLTTRHFAAALATVVRGPDS